MRKTLLILGAGTGGTMLANKLMRKFSPDLWRVVVVEKEPAHYYQSGLLGLVFGLRSTSNIRKPKKNFLPDGVELIYAEVEEIVPDKNYVLLRHEPAGESYRFDYDQLVIATGADIYPEENPGLMGSGWQKSIFDFYTFEGAENLRHTLESWQGGRLVVNVAEMPIKCPVAPLEFLFLADQYFSEASLRSKVELVYAVPISEVFSRPEVVPVFEDLITDKNIHLETDFYLKSVDPDKKRISSFTGQELEYDLLVTVPTNMGAKAIGRSDLGTEFRFVSVDMHTLQSDQYENVWGLGDAADLPCPKTASAIHGMSETVVENILRLDAGRPLARNFDGETKCIISVGDRRSLLLAFSYSQPPVPGKYPLPGVGPFSILKATRVNYWSKSLLLWMYWNLFLTARFTPPNYTRGEKHGE